MIAPEQTVIGKNGVIDGLLGAYALTADEIADFETVLSTDAGRRLFARIIYSVGKLDAVTWAGAIKHGGAIDHHSSFAAGYKSMVKTICLELEWYLPDRLEQINKIQFEWRQEFIRQLKKQQQETRKP